jgi:hypothetical protein
MNGMALQTDARSFEVLARESSHEKFRMHKPEFDINAKRHCFTFG